MLAVDRRTKASAAGRMSSLPESLIHTYTSCITADAVITGRSEAALAVDRHTKASAELAALLAGKERALAGRESELAALQHELAALRHALDAAQAALEEVELLHTSVYVPLPRNVLKLSAKHCPGVSPRQRNMS